MEIKVGFSLFRPFSETHLIAERKVCLRGITCQPSQQASSHLLGSQEAWEGKRRGEKRPGQRTGCPKEGGGKKERGGLSRGGRQIRGGKRKDSKITPNPLGPILHVFDHFWKDGLRKYNYSQLSITAKEGSPFQVLVIITT